MAALARVHPLQKLFLKNGKLSATHEPSNVIMPPRLKPAASLPSFTMTYHLSDAVTLCRKCHRRGHCKGPNCHRCRAAAMEKLFAALLRRLASDTQSTILWYCLEHPLITFKSRVTNLGALCTTARSGGPGFVQLRSKGGPGRGPGPSYRMVQICRSVLRQKRGIMKTIWAKFKTKAFLNDRCYDVATLTCYGDFLLAIAALLY